MNKIELNETPIRTCKNYLINNIKLENVNIPSKVDKFSNTIFQDFDEKNIEISKDVSLRKLKYGNGDILDNQFEKSNAKIKLLIKNNSKNSNIVNFIFDNKNTELIDDIEIIVEENVNANLVIRYAINGLEGYSNDSLRYLSDKLCDFENCQNIECLKKVYSNDLNSEALYHNGRITTYLKNNSKLNITVENLLSKNSINFISMDNLIKDQAELYYNYIDFGADKRVINYYSNVEGKNAVNKFNSIYLGENKQTLDYNYIAEIYGKNADVNIEVQGAIRDKVHKNFKGTIDFKKGCEKAKGSENEYCTLLSDTARAISLPMLLCTEEDVEGAHSTAAGKVGTDEMFYIMSRGFNEKEAEKLIVRANFNEIVESIPVDSIKQEIINQIDYRL